MTTLLLALKTFVAAKLGKERAKRAWEIAKFSIPVPVVVLVIMAVAILWERDSAIERHVETATRELVDRSELAAAEAKAEALAKIIAELDKQAARQAAANARFQAHLSRVTLENESLANDLDALKSRPVNDQCVVDDALVDFLRNN